MAQASRMTALCASRECTVHVCKRCQQTLPLEEFVRDVSRPNGRKPYCKPCYASKRREYVKENEERIRSYQDTYNKRYREGQIKPRSFNPNGSYQFKRQYLDDKKREAGCFYCREAEPCCLSFHHRDPKEKSFGVADFIGRSIQELDDEIQKCVVLCENCHRKVHAGLLSSFTS